MMNQPPETEKPAKGTKEASSPFAGDPPSDLLDWISGGNKAEQAQATKELYQRYCKHLSNKLKKRLSQYDESFLEDLVIQTFTIVFEKADAFKKVTDETASVQEKRFMKWMATIANNLFNNWLRQQPDISTMSDDFWELAAERSSPKDTYTEEQQHPRNEAVREALNELSERECEILYALMSHCPDTTNKQSKLPRKVIAELCNRFNTTPENLRAIRSRAKKKIKAHLENKGLIS